MGNENLDQRFGDGSAEDRPRKHTKGISGTVLFPPTDKVREHSSAITNVGGNPINSTPLKSDIDPATVSDQSLLHATFRIGN